MKRIAILGSTGSIGRDTLGVALSHPPRGARGRLSLPSSVDTTGAGTEGLIAVATHPEVDLVVCASSGTAALEAVLAAIEAGKTIALANKEVLVMAGRRVMSAARRKNVPILPVD